ncbi:helix-turn-helix domain-containing protein [Leptospira fletcheri]|uniref:helix-turn-helix domain-containing protein n=1 Tax=Leptospira fletcheri TaxID=2484981 RepID=UPI00319E7518
MTTTSDLIFPKSVHSFLQEITFFGFLYCLLIGTGAMLRPERTVTFRILALLCVSVSAEILSVYFLLKDIYFEPSFINHFYIPFAWLLGPGMYSLFSITATEGKFSRFELVFYAPAVGFFLGFPLISFFSPNLFASKPIEYFTTGRTSWLDILLLLAYVGNLCYYLRVVWETRSIFQIRNLKESTGARLLLYIIFGSGSLTFLIVLAYLLRDIHLLFISVVGTITYAAIGYLAQIWFPQIFHEIGPSVREAYQNSRLESVDLNALQQKLEILMQKEKLYLEEDLSLQVLSGKLDIKPYQLSEYLNQHRKTNFSRFVNSFRVEEAMQLLKKERDANILSVAYRSGFNSKATFNLAFKSVTGLSPREYLRSLKNS